jgi:hypothetical protein
VFVVNVLFVVRMVWNSDGADGKKVAFWSPLVEDGYVSLGGVITNGYDKPDPGDNEVMCVAERFCEPAGILVLFTLQGLCLCTTPHHTTPRPTPPTPSPCKLKVLGSRSLIGLSPRITATFLLQLVDPDTLF